MAHVLTSPLLVGADNLEVERMSFDLMSAVNRCDEVLRRHGMQMQILCEECCARELPEFTVRGDNSRHGSTFSMTCGHKRRVYHFEVG